MTHYCRTEKKAAQQQNVTPTEVAELAGWQLTTNGCISGCLAKLPLTSHHKFHWEQSDSLEYAASEIIFLVCAGY